MYSRFRERVLKIIHIPKEECDAFFASEKVVEFLKPKELFIKQGEVSKKLSFVNKGVLRMYYLSAEGKEINTRFFLENDFVVEYQSFLLQKPGRYFIEALQPCELITIQHATLQKAFENSYLWNKFGRIVAEKSYVQAEKRNETLLFLSAEERYLELQRKHSAIFEQVPLYHIASYLGIERESLSRLRKKLSHTNRL